MERIHHIHSRHEPRNSTQSLPVEANRRGFYSELIRSYTDNPMPDRAHLVVPPYTPEYQPSPTRSSIYEPSGMESSVKNFTPQLRSMRPRQKASSVVNAVLQLISELDTVGCELVDMALQRRVDQLRGSTP